MKKILKNSLLTLLLMFAMAFAMNIDVYAASAPGGLMQTDDGTTSVEVTWKAVVEPNVYGYNVYYSTSPNGPWVRTDSGNYDTTSTEEYINGLSAGQSYYVRVSTVTRTGDYPYTYSEGAPCSPIEVVTTPASTGTTTMVQTNATLNSVTVALNGVAGANYYILTSGDYIIGESTTNIVTNNKIALGAATRLYVRCYGCRISSSGYIAQGPYDYIAVTTLANKIPTDYFGVTTIYANINTYYFGAIVGDGQCADGLEFEFMKKNGKAKKIFTTNSNEVRIANYINKTFRKYRVRSYVNCNGTKVYSEWSDFRYIGMPKNFKSYSYSRSKIIKLNWSKVTDASRFVVYISNKENSGFKKVKTLKSNQRSITITKYGKKALKKGTYYVRLVPQIKVGKKYKNSDVIWTSKITIY